MVRLAQLGLIVLLFGGVGSEARAKEAPGKKKGPAKQAAEHGQDHAVVDPKLQKEINAAIERGAKWLVSIQERDGEFRMPSKQSPSPFQRDQRKIGLNALVLYTLAHCGHDAKSKVVRKSVTWLRKKYKSLYKGVHIRQATSYSLSILVLALHTLYANPEVANSKVESDRYGAAKNKSKNPCGYPKWAKRAIFEMLDWMVERVSKEGTWRYPGKLPGAGAPPGDAGGENIKHGPNYGGPEDLSCTQYVLLAIWAGTRCGYHVKEEVLIKAVNRLLEWQDADGPKVIRKPDPKAEAKDAPSDPSAHRYAEPKKKPEDPDKHDGPVDRARGFGYTPGCEATGAMTAAGLSSLMIAKAILQERYALKSKLHAKVDQGIWDGIAWLQHSYTVEGNPPVDKLEKEWHYYYLYGLERALVIAQKKMLGEHAWYEEGATLLVKAQQKDGRWAPQGSAGKGAPANLRLPMCDTCFALLFLRRATVTPKIPVLKGPVVTGHKKEDTPPSEPSVPAK